MGHGFTVRVDVDDHDVVFDGDGRGTTFECRELCLEGVEVFFLLEKVWGRGLPRTGYFVGENDSSLP